MKKTWIIVANSSYAQILEVKGLGKEMKVLQTIEFPEGRMKVSDLVTDKPGRSGDSLAGGRHSMAEEKDIKTHEAQVFSHQLAAILHKAKSQGEFEQLAIIAPATFLGEMEPILSDIVRKAIYKHVTKDLPQSIKPQERDDLIARYLDLWNH